MSRIIAFSVNEYKDQLLRIYPKDYCDLVEVFVPLSER